MASTVSSAPLPDLLGSTITLAPPAGPEPSGRPGSITRLGSMTPPGPMIRLDSMTTDESRSSRSSNSAPPSASRSMARLDSPNSRPPLAAPAASPPAGPARPAPGAGRVRDQLEWRPAATGQPAGDERAAVHGSVQHGGGKDRGVVPLCASSLAAVGQDRLNPVPRSCRATADARRCPHIACISVAEPGCHRLHRIRIATTGRAAASWATLRPPPGPTAGLPDRRDYVALSAVHACRQSDGSRTVSRMVGGMSSTGHGDDANAPGDMKRRDDAPPTADQLGTIGQLAGVSPGPGPGR